jgi:PAS domain S-box-containing protein
MRKIFRRLVSDLRWRLLLLVLLACAPLVGFLFAEADGRLNLNQAGLGLAACLAFVLGWIGSYLMVLRPVRTLVHSSARLAAGELSTSKQLSHTRDELGQLTRSFDQMAKILELREVDGRSTDQALQSSEMRYRRLFETAPDGILILNADTGQIDDVNPCLINLLGCTREQLLGNKLWEIGPFKDTKASQAAFKELQHETYVRYEDLPLETSAGKSINVEFVSNVYQANGGNVIQCNIRDITERKQAEAKRGECSRKLQMLSRRLVAAQESERRHIARELHDEIGQALTVMQSNLQAMLQSPKADGPTPRLDEDLKVIQRVLEQVKDISWRLRPSILDDLGLEAALRAYTNRQAAMVKMKVAFHADWLEQRLDPVIETACFRVAQEALTNALRHAHASKVTVDLQTKDDRLLLSVCDDGAGFDVASVRERAVQGASLGLLSMEERAALAGGGLEFQSAPGQGTHVLAWFPLRWPTHLPKLKSFEQPLQSLP